MRTAIVGGGPGGLFLAALLKRHDPRQEVVVFERNPAGATYGFGVAFSDRSLSHLDAADPGVEAAIRGASITWDNIQIRHRGQRIRAYGHRLSAVSRRELLDILAERAVERGAEVHFEAEISGLDELGDYDLIVAADGVNSLIRSSHAEAFGPSLVPSRAKYIWCGADAPSGVIVDCLTFIFEETEYGRFGVHAYPYAADSRTTFIVEADEPTWRRAGLDRHEDDPLPPGATDEDALAFCQEVFAEHLGDEPLRGNNSRWLTFQTLRCRTWSHGNIVLLGDAAHTAHFSLGSGTTLAMEDAVALCRALAGSSDLAGALRTYEATRRPEVERLQSAAMPSVGWWDRFARYMDFGPEQFAFHFLTRTGLMRHGRLQRRDPRFTCLVREWFASTNGDGAQDVAGHPMRAPLELPELRLPNRLVARPRDGAAAEPDMVRLVGYAACGAGMVVARVPVAALLDDARVERWAEVAGAVHDGTPARFLLELDDPVPPGEAAEVGSHAAKAGADALGLRLDVAALHGPDDVRERLEPVRRGWPADRALVAMLSFDRCSDGVDLDALEELGAALEREGCALVGVMAAPASPLPGMKPDMAQVVISDAIRNGPGLPTMLVGGIADDDDAITWLLSSRADLCCGEPLLASLGWRENGR